MTLDELNRLPLAAAREALERCCGARAWVEGMCAARPWRDGSALLAAAERVADALGREDWLEAFARHPRIGDRDALRSKFAAAPAAGGEPQRSVAAWARAEQRGAASASELTLDALAEANRAYERRFGYIFIVCATGKSAGEMLALLRARLANDPEAELANAAREQRAITRLRLEKLLGEPA